MRAALAAALLLLTVAFAGCIGAGVEVEGAAIGDTPAGVSEPFVVLAHIDTGINPYHETFRDASPLAFAHPSTYLPGYPADVPVLELTLDAPDLETALERDAAVWDAVERGTLYWIPGTRIVGAISFGNGGTNCPLVGVPPASALSTGCPERVILDDHGHGTMTASRAAAAEHALAPSARIVSIEGTGADSVRWAADQGWIDVQTNSWLGFVPPPVDNRIGPAFAHAAQRMVTIAASGNGAAYITGFAPTPTYVLNTAAPGVILVGAHDNGHVAAWSGAPAHVVTDGFGGPIAARDSLTGFGPSPIACCTSAAAPYAAGGAAALVLEARRLVGDTTGGVREGGVLAQGSNALASGPLDDGALTIDELRDLLVKTADARPKEGPDDGAKHWGAQGRAPDPSNPAGNPYCLGCWSAPAKWTDVPADAPAVASIGYGAVDPSSVKWALMVLRGEADLPERPVEDAFFALDAQARRAVFG